MITKLDKGTDSAIQNSHGESLKETFPDRIEIVKRKSTASSLQSNKKRGRILIHLRGNIEYKKCDLEEEKMSRLSTFFHSEMLPRNQEAFFRETHEDQGMFSESNNLLR